MASTDPTKPRRSFWLSLRGFFAALGALLTTGVAIVGLFLPSESHDSDTVLVSSPATPTAMKGEIIDVKDATVDGCCAFSVRFELSGFNARDCVLSATLIDAYDGTQTPGDEDTVLTPEADVDRASTEVDVPVDAVGSYSVRFVLTDPDGVELDRFETEDFDVGDA